MAPVGESPPGGNNSANYDWAVGSSTDVGSYPNSVSYYGTFDQVGNVWEFVEDTFGVDQRGRRGDSFTGWYGSGHIGHFVGTGAGTFTDDSDTGFRVATTICELTIDAILDFFDECVELGTLFGNGPGNSANGRLNALRNMLEMAGDLINIGDIEVAYGQLKAAYKKCDSDPAQPDFVTGDAVSTLSEMILNLMESLGCE